MLRLLKVFSPAGLLLFFAIGGFAQAPSPAGTAVSPQLVVVDVAATDKSGHPVRDLKQADFTVLEDGVPQTLKAFEAHAASGAAESAGFSAPPAMPPNIFTNYGPPPEGATVNVLVLDELNTPLKDQPYLRDQLLEYVKKAAPGAPVAILALDDRLSLLQGFTSDPAILKAAIENSAPGASRSLPDSAAGVVATGGPDSATLLAAIQHFDAGQQPAPPPQRAQETLDAMNMLARYLAGVPGRKNLVWLSGSFPLSILPDGNVNNPFGAAPHAEDEFREIAHLLGSSRVAVYPIELNPSGDASPLAANAGSGAQSGESGRDVMLQMAQATGGRAFVNTAGLAETIAQALQAGSSYYTLAYVPAHPGSAGAYHKIEVKVGQPDVTLEYRHGYYSADAAKEASSGGAAAGMPNRTMRLAMLRGGPDPTQIVFKTRILPSPDAKEGSPAPDNQISKSKEAKGPYRRYMVDIAADPAGVSFLSDSGGKYKGDLQAVVFVYDQDGALVNQTGKEMVTDLTLDKYKPIFAHGIQFHEEVSVPLSGDYYLRIGLHDLNSDHVGAIETPIAAIQNVPAAAKK